MDRHQAIQAIAAEVDRGELHFPMHAELGMKIRQFIDDPGCHVDSASKLVQADPLLTAQIVAIANSVTYNPSGREITDVKTAIARLGFATLRSVVMARIARQIAGQPVTPECRRMGTQLWEHTAHVAALARVIAKRITRQDPETALFAGVLHEVGGFYLLSRSADYPSLLTPIDANPGIARDSETDPAEEAHDVEHAVCLAVLKRLDVPKTVIDAIEESGSGRGYLGMPPRTLCDTLLLADYLTPVPSPLWRAAPAANEGAGAASLDLTTDQETLSDILNESAAEVASLTAALRA